MSPKEQATAVQLLRKWLESWRTDIASAEGAKIDLADLMDEVAEETEVFLDEGGG
jgi:hypothetical protein